MTDEQNPVPELQESGEQDTTLPASMPGEVELEPAGQPGGEVEVREETLSAVENPAAVDAPSPVVEEVSDDIAPEAVAEEAEGVGEKPEPREGRAWYVIHCYSGYENRVKKTLERRIESMGMQDLIFQVVVPVEEEVELRDGKRRTVERRLFPGYILVDMVLTEESWYVVRNTPNVTGFVGMGNKPTPLAQDQVDKILQRLESEAPRVKVSFRVGQKVRITEGPFADFLGVVDEIYPDKGRVRIMVSIFGRETPMELDFLQIERV
ncbi:MAG: transcription termination/antitermination protein NusG [Anaerolineae bacterium]